MDVVRFGILEYGRRSAGDLQDTIFIVNTWDCGYCERHASCGLSLRQNEVLVVEREGVNLGAYRLELGRPTCKVGVLPVSLVGRSIIERYTDAIVQVLNCFITDLDFEEHQVNAVSEVTELRGVCECVVVGKAA